MSKKTITIDRIPVDDEQPEFKADPKPKCKTDNYCPKFWFGECRCSGNMCVEKIEDE